ncbi:hypothetical protein [Orrella marina]|uniref:Lipoprotein n=1 Tax=Orrella marina TaxID=2163011 RepID=A0A2R4XHD4_9BURK|nr:hypothetical protein [Orrella marina]AWB33171.1 hypothetical protein DBV39_04985 [Orrella marina]
MRNIVQSVAVFGGTILLTSCGLVQDYVSPKQATVFPTPSNWVALSTTAMAITGDIRLSDNELQFSNGVSIYLDLLEHEPQTGQTLFGLKDRANPVLLNGNLLCGQKPVDYLVIQVSDGLSGQPDMQMMAYYYPGHLHLAQLPLKDQNDPERMMCALYTYVKSG